MLAPLQYHGLNTKHPYYWSQIMQLETIIRESLHQSPTKALIQVMMEDLYRESDCPREIMDIPFSILQDAW